MDIEVFGRDFGNDEEYDPWMPLPPPPESDSDEEPPPMPEWSDSEEEGPPPPAPAPATSETAVPAALTPGGAPAPPRGAAAVPAAGGPPPPGPPGPPGAPGLVFFGCWLSGLICFFICFVFVLFLCACSRFLVAPISTTPYLCFQRVPPHVYVARIPFQSCLHLV